MASDEYESYWEESEVMVQAAMSVSSAVSSSGAPWGRQAGVGGLEAGDGAPAVGVATVCGRAVVNMGLRVMVFAGHGAEWPRRLRSWK